MQNQTTTKQPTSARAFLQLLGATYQVFRESKPLAIGINKQLAELHPDVEAKVLRVALFHHTRSIGYLKAMSKAEQRFDLSGNPAGEVTAEQRQHAVDQLKEISQKRNEARKAEEQKKADALQAQKLEQLVAKFGKH